MSTVPTSIDEWTYDFIQNLVDNDTIENDSFDFKFDLPSTDVLTDLCCSFANSSGGYIIFGVKQNSKFTIRGINFDIEFARNFGDRLRAYPPIHHPPPKFIKIPDSTKVLVVMHIPLSQSRPHAHQDLLKMKF